MLAIFAAFIAGLGGFLFLSNEGVLVAKNEPAAASRAEILFAGDMMFDRSVRQWGKEKGEDYLFSCIDDVLQSADMVVANLEGPITTRPSLSVGTAIGGPNNTRFTFPTTTASLLARHGVKVVSIANNHAHDFGREGVESTMEYLDAAGVGHFGDPLGERVHTQTVGDVPLAFIGYNEFQSLEDGEWFGSTTTADRVRQMRAAGYLPIVFAHWGQEYVAANAEQKRLARAWIDAGAEMVVGAHPHVVQEHEVYGGKHIYYSLGNFVFDQYFSDDVRNGLMLRVTFDGKGLTNISEVPIFLERDRRVCAE